MLPLSAVAVKPAVGVVWEMSSSTTARAVNKIWIEYSTPIVGIITDQVRSLLCYNGLIEDDEYTSAFFL